MKCAVLVDKSSFSLWYIMVADTEQNRIYHASRKTKHIYLELGSRGRILFSGTSNPSFVRPEWTYPTLRLHLVLEGLSKEIGWLGRCLYHVTRWGVMSGVFGMILRWSYGLPLPREDTVFVHRLIQGILVRRWRCKTDKNDVKPKAYINSAILHFQTKWFYSRQ